MTVLYIGGAAQGKRALAQQLHGVPDGAVWYGAACGTIPTNARLIDGLHLLVRRAAAREEDVAALLPQLRDKILVCDELGCGIVPLDPAERAWREQVGRLCCTLAAEAALVVRVTAGVPQVLKGKLP